MLKQSCKSLHSKIEVSLCMNQSLVDELCSSHSVMK